MIANCNRGAKNAVAFVKRWRSAPFYFGVNPSQVLGQMISVMLNLNQMLVITPFLKIPRSEFDFSYARSSGPGGQNVNKVNSKALLRWSVAGSHSISESIRTLLLQRLAPRLTFEGDLIITSDKYRDQIRNREDCIEKLHALLLMAVHVPKVRKKTKPSRSSRNKVKEKKTKHSQKKNLRRLRRHDHE